MATKSKKRDLYGVKELGRLINPKTIAVVGASATKGSFANNTQTNLKTFKGDLYYVNPKYNEIDGIACYPSVKDLPVSPDCVICCLPRIAVEEAVLACADKGAGGVIIFASGYKETGLADRIEEEARLTEIAETRNIRIIGPNSIGIYNVAANAAFTFTPGTNRPELKVGPIGIVSQSGALGTALAQCVDTGVGFSHFLPCGNSCDVDVCDLVNYLVEEPNTRAVTCLLEGVKNGARLIELGWRSLEHDTPVVWYKTGVGEISTQAVLSHTGTLVGTHEAYEAAFRKTGMVTIDNMEHLIETAQFLAKAGKPKAQGAGIIVGSGGSGIICSDKAEEFGVSLPQPQGKTLEILKRVVPEFGSAANPVDVTAEVLRQPQYYRDCIAAILDDPDYGVLAMPQTVALSGIIEGRAALFEEMAEKYGKPIVVPWTSPWREGPGSELLEKSAHVAIFRSTSSTFAAIAAWLHRDKIAKRRREKVKPLTDDKAEKAARAALADAGGDARSLTERDSKKILAAYGVNVTREKLVTSAEAAVATAEEIGFPVVMKAESPDIPHKTEAGVIRLNLKNAAEVRAAYDAILAAANRVTPAPRINGIVVQNMALAGTEMMVGARNDPQFGPLVTVGLGGIWVEVMRDTAFSLAPVSRLEAREMIQSLKSYKLLTGFRGTPPADIEQLVDTVCRVSELAADLSDEIAEIDVNPVLTGPDGCIAVDALVIRNEEDA